MALVFSNAVVGGVTLVRAAIQSPNYVTGVSGWTINQDGTVEFASGTFRGDLSIGTSPTWFRVDSTGNMWSGAATAATASFSVTNVGAVTIRAVGAPNVALTIADILAAAPYIYPTLKVQQPYATEPTRQIILSSGQTAALDSEATVFLRGRRTAPVQRSYAQLDAQQIQIGSAATSFGAIAISGTVGVQITAPIDALSSFKSANTITCNDTGGASGTPGILASNSAIWGTLTAGTGASWDLQNIVANSPGGNAGMSIRTAPVAAQFRLGNGGPNDIFCMNAGGGAAITLQAAAFVIFSRLSSKVDVTELAEHVPDALALVRKLRPVRYRQAGAERLAPLATWVDDVHPNTRGRNKAQTIRNIEANIESSITHLGLVVDDLAPLLPDAIHPGEDGTPGGYSLSAVVAVLIRAVQQLADTVEGHTTWNP